jgi:hypothetical protein
MYVHTYIMRVCVKGCVYCVGVVCLNLYSFSSMGVNRVHHSFVSTEWDSTPSSTSTL